MLNRLRKIVANRRRARRYRVQRRVRLVFSLTVVGDDARTRVMPVEGYTRDVSDGGLALIVPSLRVGEAFLTDSSCRLRIVLLDLPTGEIEIEAMPVRYEELAAGDGHLIGVKITRISDGDRSRLVQYLRTSEP
jgi:c-di-GMP-binding flagellar brake protein YcgR